MAVSEEQSLISSARLTWVRELYNQITCAAQGCRLLPVRQKDFVPDLAC